MMQLGCDGVFVGSGIVSRRCYRIHVHQLTAASRSIVRLGQPRSASQGHRPGHYPLQQPQGEFPERCYTTVDLLC